MFRVHELTWRRVPERYLAAFPDRLRQGRRRSKSAVVTPADVESASQSMERERSRSRVPPRPFHEPLPQRRSFRFSKAASAAGRNWCPFQFPKPQLVLRETNTKTGSGGGTTRRNGRKVYLFRVYLFRVYPFQVYPFILLVCHRTRKAN